MKGTIVTMITIRIIGEGLRVPAGTNRDGLHLGIQRGSATVQVVPGSSGPGAGPAFHLSVDASSSSDGAIDFRGPFVHGTRGSRFLYLCWGKLDPDGAFDMVMRMKVKLGGIDRALIERALIPGATLQGTLPLVDEAGTPLSGTIRPEHISWTVIPGASGGD